MTDDDEPRFRTCYHRLCAAFVRKRDVNEYQVYRRALMPISIAAIEAAVDEVSRDGGRWFPKTTDLFERGANHDAALSEAAREERRRLEPDRDQIDREMPRLEAAREAAILECHGRGDYRGAAMIAQLTPRHPLEYVEPDPVAVTPGRLARSSAHRELIEGRTGEMRRLVEHTETE